MCGRILAYQAGTTDAFRSSVSAGRTSIDSAYVDGVSVTHGQKDLDNTYGYLCQPFMIMDPNYNSASSCPCTNTR